MPKNQGSGIFWKCVFQDGFVRKTESPINPKGGMTNWGKNQGHGLCVSTQKIPKEALDKPIAPKIEFPLGVTSHLVPVSHVNIVSEVSSEKPTEEVPIDTEEDVILDNEKDDQLVNLIAIASDVSARITMMLEKLFEFCSDDNEIFDSKFLLSFSVTIKDRNDIVSKSIDDILENLRG